MEEKTSTNNLSDNGTKSKLNLDKYHSVQFSLNDMGPVYLFKLRNIRLSEPCILVKEDSTVLKQLKVGDILDMEYNPPGLSGHHKLLRTRISSKNIHDRFTGHSLLGLSIIEEKD